jgi:DNA ligase D-like protein (predicted 3'-phosphoesterase)
VADDDPLAEYWAKRDLAASGEPTDGQPGEQPRFVIQRHEASTLHYDFRLEVDGVLKSWAVPKGPSLDPRVKRLAIRTEDHPLDYATFEGRIPEGQYGAGTVIVWDIGTYRNLTEHKGKPVPVSRAIEQGHVKVWLDGRKLTGAFALTRTDLPGRGEQWLLVKVDDEFADRRRDPTVTAPESVLSGRTNEDLERV